MRELVGATQTRFWAVNVGPPPPYDPMTETEHLARVRGGDRAAVIDGLGLKDVILVGHSMGGAEVVRYLGRHGTGKVRKVALMAAVAPSFTVSPAFVATTGASLAAVTSSVTSTYGDCSMSIHR